MKKRAWIMRPIRDVFYKDARNGAHALLELTCGHVIEWKASRYRTYSPKRCRCEDCEDIYFRFMDPGTSAQVVRLVERGTANDFTTSKSRAGSRLAGGHEHLLRDNPRPGNGRT